MKNIQFFYIVAALLTAFTSCKKAEDIDGVGYGQLNVSSVFSGNAAPLLVQVNGETKDTLTASKPATLQNIFLHSGEYEVKLVNQETKKVLSDTTITIETAKIISLPAFFYTGSEILFDDFTAKPEQDSMLVRFIILDPTLPDELDITFSLYDFDQINFPMEEKRVNGVRKDRGSSYIQFPNPNTIFPDASFILYAIEAYKAGTNEKVMDIASGTYSYIVTSGFQPFLANGVSLIGIGPWESGAHAPVVIFSHIAE